MSQRYLSINQLNELTGIDRRTIKKRLTELPIHAQDGRATLYDAHKALPMLYAGDTAGASPANITNQLREEELKLERAKREKLEIEIGRLRGELVPIDEVARTVEKEFNFVRSQVRAMPSKLAKPLSMISDPHDVFERISQVVDECLTELTADKTYEEHARGLESARGASGSESPSDTGSVSET